MGYSILAVYGDTKCNKTPSRGSSAPHCRSSRWTRQFWYSSIVLWGLGVSLTLSVRHLLVPLFLASLEAQHLRQNDMTPRSRAYVWWHRNILTSHTRRASWLATRQERGRGRGGGRGRERKDWNVISHVLPGYKYACQLVGSHEEDSGMAINYHPHEPRRILLWLAIGGWKSLSTLPLIGGTM